MSGRTPGEQRCWALAYQAALGVGKTDQRAREYADACLAAYRREAAVWEMPR